MRKNLYVGSLVALFVSLASVSFAEVGVQFRVPYQATANEGNVKTGGSGSSVMLTFDIDSTTTVGILNEQINFSESVAGANVTGRYNVNALRVAKLVSDPIYVGVNLGSANFTGAGGLTPQTTLADVFGGLKLMSSKGKVTSSLNFEVTYRFLKAATAANAGGATDFGGTLVSLGAGVTF